jgi:hypothetical protein
VKFRVTSLGIAQVATRVRHRVTRSGMTWVSNSSKVSGSNSGKESGTVSVRVWVSEQIKTRVRGWARQNVQDRGISLLRGRSELKKEVERSPSQGVQARRGSKNSVQV